MPVFQYKALQNDGAIAEGQIEAGGRQEAFRQMEGRGLRPISLAERAGGNGNGKSKAAAAKDVTHCLQWTIAGFASRYAKEAHLSWFIKEKMVYEDFYIWVAGL